MHYGITFQTVLVSVMVYIAADGRGIHAEVADAERFKK